MKNEALIRVYTRPLFDLAVESSQLDLIGREVETLADLFREVPSLAEYLDSPNVSRTAKLDLLKQTYDRPWSEYFANSLDLILRKGRQEILPHIWGVYLQLWDDYRARVDVTVTTAVELSTDQQRALMEKLALRTGKQITLKRVLDPAVLGGMRVQIGHQLVDATLSTQLATLKEVLLKG
jgi:F-type H+-transporting ATPase subunit delta